jgi:holin-like protein
MLLLAAGLRAGLVPRDEVRPVAAILTRHMGLFLVPAAVGVAGLLDRLSGLWAPVLLASVTSTLIVLVVVGLGAGRRPA